MKRRTFIKSAFTLATATPLAASAGDPELAIENMSIPVLNSGPSEGRIFHVEIPSMPDARLKCIEVKKIGHSAPYLLSDGRVIRADCIASAGQLRANLYDGAGWQTHEASSLNPLVLGRVLEVKQHSSGD